MAGSDWSVRGIVEKVTSYGDAAGTTAVNQVQNAFNNFGQLATQYQEHGGVVNTGTSPKVQYAYENGAGNSVRPTSMTYPNGRVLEYQYDDTAADKLSRVRTLRFDGTNVCRYAYLGLGGFVTTDYLQPQVKLNYALGSGANPYTGFDRFGRIVDLLWQNYAGGGSELVHLKYGYDRASNRTHREDVVATSLNKNFDELYEYDGLQRLAKFHRGRLTADKRAITSPAFQQGWQLDATGNWQNFTQNDQSDADNTLDQQRVANRVNEITQIARTVGQQWVTPSYDRNGNSTLTPQPANPTLGFKLTWDAWNRLVLVQEPDGGGWRNLATYSYNGNNWRIEAKTYTAGTLTETRHAYFTAQWQNIEERLGTTPSSAPADRQFVWGARYIDDLVLRDRSVTGGTLNERLYPLQDANWNVVALTDSSGTIQERYAYQSYGTPEFLTPTFAATAASLVTWETFYASYRFDAETDLYCVRRRFYHSVVGRWMIRDYVKEDMEENAYGYIGNSPLNNTDPSGLLCYVHKPLMALPKTPWTFTATAGGLASPTIATNPGIISVGTGNTVVCKRTRTIQVNYDCCCGLFGVNTTSAAFFDFTQEETVTMTLRGGDFVTLIGSSISIPGLPPSAKVGVSMDWHAIEPSEVPRISGLCASAAKFSTRPPLPSFPWQWCP